MSAAQAIRGSVALSRKTREPYVQRHAIFNWLALFSLIAAGASIYVVRLQQGFPTAPPREHSATSWLPPAPAPTPAPGRPLRL
jgi:hypothetical protein